MAARNILHLFSPLRHVSPFDVNMALDAGYDAVVPYTGVDLEDVRGLVQDAIFSRTPQAAPRTGIFIAGKNALIALDMLEAARKAMFPPFLISVFADPSGSFTTSAAMIARIGKELKSRHQLDWRGRTISIFGGTGVVGFSAGVLAAGEGAKVRLIGYDGTERVKRLAEVARARFGTDMTGVDGSSEDLKHRALADSDVVIAAGRAGVEIISASALAAARTLKVAADVNAVPPAGIAGLGVKDDGKPLAGTPGVGIGPLAIGAIKYRVQFELLKRMTESDKAVLFDFRDAFKLARELVG